LAVAPAEEGLFSQRMEPRKKKKRNCSGTTDDPEARRVPTRRKLSEGILGQKKSGKNL